MRPLFAAARRFSPADGKRWDDYLAFSKVAHLKEVVSLDTLLTPPLPEQLLPADWAHIVNEDFMLRFFTDLPYLKSRLSSTACFNLLCVFKEPQTHPIAPPGFSFVGYELLDRHGDISPLTNCGGFPKAFSNEELTPEGLLPSLERALAVRRDLRAFYPEEPHADASVWAIFRSPT